MVPTKYFGLPRTIAAARSLRGQALEGSQRDRTRAVLVSVSVQVFVTVNNCNY